MSAAKQTFWHVHGSQPKAIDFVRDAATALDDVLARAGVEARLSALRPTLATDLEPYLSTGDLEGLVRTIADWPRLSAVSVYSRPADPIARAARGRLPHAVWGLSRGGLLSLTYCPDNPYAFWHETLHLFGLADHYEPRTFRQTCELQSCIMQYAPDEGTVGHRPFLCRESLRVLRTCQRRPKSARGN